MSFIVKKDYAPHNFKVGDIVVINEVAFAEEVHELVEQGVLERNDD